MLALDLFCGAGGAALGLMEAGYDVIGVDLDHRHARVYPGVFVRADALQVERWLDVGQFDLVWASPPCQRWSSPAHLKPPTRPRADLIGPTRKLLHRIPAPSVIENVPAAPIRRDLALTGPTVGLPKLKRLRHFELNGWCVSQPRLVMPAGSVAAGTLVTVTKQGGIPCRRIRARRRELAPHLSPHRHHLPAMIEAMGQAPDCGWTMAQVGEAVPPAYAAWIARRVP